MTQREYLFDSASTGISDDYDTEADMSLDLEPALKKSSFMEDNEELSTSTSIFNCDGPMGLCEYFYPTKFFHADDGPGAEFRHILERIEELRNLNKLWYNMPRIGWPTFSFSPDVTNPITGKPFPTQNLSFLHVHKAGGTTIHGFMPLARKYGIGVQRHYVYHWEQARALELAKKAGAVRLQQALESEREKMSLTYYHLGTAGKYRATEEDWGPNDHLLFAVVRDPLDRFVSSIGQAMGASGSTNNVIGKTFRETCVKDPAYSKENSVKVAQCMVDYIKKEGYEIEVHFTPQAVEVAFATQLYHVPVAMFKFEDHYKEVVTELGIDSEKKQRNGEMHGYRPKPVLTDMHSTDFTPELIQEICELYKVDVIMIRTLGWSVPRCDLYIPE